jgi:hypothetical protein
MKAAIYLSVPNFMVLAFLQIPQKPRHRSQGKGAEAGTCDVREFLSPPLTASDLLAQPAPK